MMTKKNMNKKGRPTGIAAAATNTPGEGEAPPIHRGAGNTAEFMAGRRSMAYELRESGGLSPSRLGHEILYLLPDAFVEFYTDLFHRALRTSEESVMHGRSGGLDKAKGEMGMVTGSDTKLQASGSGKKWKNTPISIGSEKALAIKTAMDKGLLELVADARRAEQRQRANAEQDQGPGASLKRSSPTCHGVIRLEGVGDMGGMRRCGKFLKANWKFCPACGWEVVPIGPTRSEQH